jgi:hypothetical protein
MYHENLHLSLKPNQNLIIEFLVRPQFNLANLQNSPQRTQTIPSTKTNQKCKRINTHQSYHLSPTKLALLHKTNIQQDQKSFSPFTTKLLMTGKENISFSTNLPNGKATESLSIRKIKDLKLLPFKASHL